MTKTNGQEGKPSKTNAPPRFNPYVGPRPFLPGEELFGRDREIRDLFDQLLAERIVLLHSPSGAGKTSLVNAGLLPMLEKDGLLVLPVVRLGEEPDEKYLEQDGFNRYIFSMMVSLEGEMGESPLALGNTGEGKESTETNQAEGDAQRQGRLDELAGMSLKAYLDQRRQMLDTNLNVIIFDQFEEIITTAPTELVNKQDFFNQVGDVLRDRSLWALFVIRDDFLGALEPFALSIPTQFTNIFRLDLLGEKAAQQAIQKPIARQGITFQESAARSLVDDLRLVQLQAPNGEIVSRKGIYVEPVQLQVVCFRLYDELDLANRLEKSQIDEEDIESVGDVNTALSNYYAERVAAIAGSRNVERQVRDWFDRQLITKSGLRSQVMMEVGASSGLDNNLIRQLVKSHLVRAEKRRGVTWFELAHDRLIDPVRSDNASWSENNLNLLQRQADLWDRQRRPESMLLRETELVEAKRWAADHPEELQPVEEKFLSESISHEQRAKRLRTQRLRWVITIVAFIGFLIGLVAITATFIAIQQGRLNERLLHNNLVTQAKYYQADKYDLALLLSWAGYLAGENFTDIQEPSISLLNILQSHPGLITNLQGHVENATVTDVAFNPRKKIMASAGGGDHMIILWNVSNVRQPTELYRFEASSATVTSLVFTPDGSALASGSNDNRICLWDLSDLNQLLMGQTDPNCEPLVGHDKTISELAFSPDGKVLASASRDRTIRLWDVSDFQNPKPFDHDQPLKGHKNAVRSVAFSPDGNMLASGSCGKVEEVSGTNQCVEGEILLWDVSDPRNPVHLEPLPEGHTDTVLSLAFSPDGDILASGSIDKTILLWDVSDPLQPNQLNPALKEHTDEVKSVAFSPDGKTLVSGGDDNVIRLWNVDAESDEFGKHLMALSGHPGAIRSVAFGPYREAIILASGGGQGSVILWGLDETYQPVQSLQLARLNNEAGGISVMAFSADGKTLASAGSGGNDIQLWDVSDVRNPAQLSTTLQGHDGQVRSLAFSPDGKILASGSCGVLIEDRCAEGQILLWDVSDPGKLVQLARSSEGHTGEVLSLTFSPDGKILASGSCGVLTEDRCAEGQILLWEVSDPSKPFQLARSSEGHTGDVLSLDFSPEGNTLASGSSDNKIRLWDVSDPSKPNPLNPVLEGHTNKVNYLAFSPDGQILASGSEDATIRLWDVSNPTSSSFGERLGDPLTSHGGSVNSLTFSPDGRTLASGSDDDTIRLWDIYNPHSPIEYEPPIAGHTGDVVGLAFSPVGKFLVSGGEDNTIRLWCTNDECWREIICQRAGRNLTLSEWGEFFPEKSEADYAKDRICSQYPIDTPTQE